MREVFLKQNFLKMSLVGAILCPSSMNAIAGSDDYLHVGRIDPYAHHGRASNITAKVYVSVPFGALENTPFDDTRFGLSLSGRLPGQTYDGYGNGGLNQTKFFDLSITPEGTDDLRINGLPLRDMNTLYADGDEEKRGPAWPWVVGGAVVIGVLAVGIIGVNNSLDFTDSDRESQ